jgi:hypothetical protein
MGHGRHFVSINNNDARYYYLLLRRMQVSIIQYTRLEIMTAEKALFAFCSKSSLILHFVRRMLVISG